MNIDELLDEEEKGNSYAESTMMRNKLYEVNPFYLSSKTDFYSIGDLFNFFDSLDDVDLFTFCIQMSII